MKLPRPAITLRANREIIGENIRGLEARQTTREVALKTPWRLASEKVLCEGQRQYVTTEHEEQLHAEIPILCEPKEPVGGGDIPSG